jgi:protein-S-isoprenylcysteine O-methyltransferase Ste14
MYLGMAVGYAGFSLLADSVLTLAGLPVALVIMHYGVIKREERYLEGKFGDSYATYRRSVRRWI